MGTSQEIENRVRVLHCRNRKYIVRLAGRVLAKRADQFFFSLSRWSVQEPGRGVIAGSDSPGSLEGYFNQQGLLRAKNKME